MIFQYHTNNKAIEVLNDLIKIHNDRIAGYQHALEQQNIDSDLYEEFEKIISKSDDHKQQLREKVTELNGRAKTQAPILGKIYNAWTDLKVTFAGNTQKAIIANCLYNEEVALHAYNAALSLHVEMTLEALQLIEEQESELKKVYEKMKRYKDARHTVDYRMLYYT